MAKIYDQTFIQWIENILRTGYQLPGATVEVSKNTWTKTWTISVRPIGPDKDADELRAAIAIGDEQEMKDISGVNLTIKTPDILANPKGALGKLASAIQNDILNLDELGTTKGAKIMGNIVRGKLTDADGRDLRTPHSFILQTIGLRGPDLEKANGDKLFKLVSDATPNAPDTKLVDRRSLEIGEVDLPNELQSYKKMSQALINLAENEEETGGRVVARNNVQKEFSRSLARELNLDPQKIFSWSKKIEGKSHQGSIDKWLADHKGRLPEYGTPNFSSEMAQALSMSDTDFDAFSDPTKKYLSTWLESEKYSRMISGDENFTGKGIREKIKTNLGIDIVNPKDIKDAQNVFPSWMNEETKKAWVDFSKDKVSSKDRIGSNFDLRDAYFKQGRFDEYIKLAGTDIGLGLEGTANYRLKNLWADDLNYIYEQKLVMQHVLYEIDAPRIRADVYESTLRKTHNPKSANEAVTRLEALQNSNLLAHNLTAHATIKGLLESLHEGKLSSSLFMVSRFAGSMPLLSKRYRAFRPYTQFLEIGTYENLINKSAAGQIIGKISDPKFGTDQAITKAPITGWATAAGLTYAGDHKVGLMRLPIFSQVSDAVLQNHHFAFHEKYALNQATGKMDGTGIWSVTKVNYGDINGFFDKKNAGVFNLLKDIEHNKEAFDYTLLLGGDINSFFTNSSNMLELKNALQFIKENNDLTAFFAAPENARPLLNLPGTRFGAMLQGIGAQGENVELLKNIDTYITNLETLVPVDAAGNIIESKFFQFIARLKKGGKVEDDQLWFFFSKLKASGKGGNLLSRYIGPLDFASRYANLAHDYLFKSIIWGNTFDFIPMAKGLKGLLRKVSAPDGVNLVRAAENWPVVKSLVSFGQALQKVSGIGSTAAVVEGQAALSGMVGARAGAFITRIAAQKAMSGVLLNLGTLLTKAASYATGPISFVVAILGKTALSASFKILKLDFKGARGVVKSDLKGLWITTKKFVLYPLGCIVAIPCLGCVGIAAMLLLLIIPGGMAPYEETTAGVSSILNSQMIRVTKEDVTTSGAFPGLGAYTRIYKIDVTNTSSAPVTISSFEDKLSMLTGCENNSNTGSMFMYGDAGFIGSLYDPTAQKEIGLSDIAAQFMGKVLGPGESATYNISVRAITTEDATYYNTVTVGVKEEPGRTSSAVASSVIGAGGCTSCPDNWPVCAPGTACSPRITYGPNDPTPGRTHSIRTEAIDFGVGVGTSIYASHDGVAITGTDPGGYGYYVKVISPMGFVSIYAHLSTQIVANNTTVKKGDLIGLSGNTGNSTGPHLHYEFQKIGGTYPECLPGQPVIMDLPYVPVSKDNLRIWYN